MLVEGLSLTLISSFFLFILAKLPLHSLNHAQFQSLTSTSSVVREAARHRKRTHTLGCV